MTTTTSKVLACGAIAAALLLDASGCGSGSGTPAAAPGDAAAPTSVAAPAAGRESTIGEVTVTPITHGSLRLRFRDRNLFVDPWSKGDLAGLGAADMIFITDVHRDHLDRKAIDALRTDKTVIVAPKAVADELADLAVTVLANGESKEIDGVGVEAVAMYNLVRGPEEGGRFHDKGRGNGYVLTLGDARIYVSGDTECTDEMRGLQRIDAAFVCMNLPYTMPPSEAAECIKAFRPKVVYPYHYRGSDLGPLEAALAGESGIELRRVDWYPGGEG
ncbi:MAG: MBL fold metallo-hydrolase [Nannocystaceae bacterium]